MSDCEFLERGGVDLHNEDLSLSARDNRDPRITVALAIDPGVIQTITSASLKEEGELDPLCSDGGGRTRAEIHQELAAMIVDFFKRKL